MSYLDWAEVETREWSEPAPPAPNGSCPPHTDWYVMVREQATWPDDGTTFANRRYEQKWIWIGPTKGHRAVIVHHSNYPAPLTEETPDA